MYVTYDYEILRLNYNMMDHVYFTKKWKQKQKQNNG